MGVRVGWDSVDQDVLVYTVEGHWTWEEFYAALGRARKLAEESDAPAIDCIIDMRVGSMFPHNALPHLRKLPAGKNPKLKFRAIVIVGENLFVKVLADLMRRLNPQAMEKFHLARTFDEARNALRNAEAVGVQLAEV